jgi:hypothetical protein
VLGHGNHALASCPTTATAIHIDMLKSGWACAGLVVLMHAMKDTCRQQKFRHGSPVVSGGSPNSHPDEMVRGKLGKQSLVVSRV